MRQRKLPTFDALFSQVVLPRSINQILKSDRDSYKIMSDLHPVLYTVIHDHTENQTHNRRLRNLMTIPIIRFISD